VRREGKKRKRKRKGKGRSEGLKGMVSIYYYRGGVDAIRSLLTGKPSSSPNVIVTVQYSTVQVKYLPPQYCQSILDSARVKEDPGTEPPNSDLRPTVSTFDCPMYLRNLRYADSDCGESESLMIHQIIGSEINQPKERRGNS